MIQEQSRGRLRALFVFHRRLDVDPELAVVDPAGFVLSYAELQEGAAAKPTRQLRIQGTANRTMSVLCGVHEVTAASGQQILNPQCR